MDEKYKTLPIIDFKPFINGTATVAVADQVVEACKEITQKYNGNFVFFWMSVELCEI